MSEPTPRYLVPRAQVSWRALKLELFLIGTSVVVLLVSLALDISSHHADWFPRSGAVMALVSTVLAFLSLGKHYNKFVNAYGRDLALATSPNQWKINIFTLLFSVIGTLVWAYGDKLLQFLHLVDAS